MKRLVFCFDGTWNRLSADTPTNVVLTAASIERTTADGVSQIIHYDEGVGTGRLEHYSGGMFGAGLVANVREAYRFLIFNYDPGDELFVFGFSRGAFTARTFVGLLRHVGPLRRLHAARIDEALALYERRLGGDADAAEEMARFRSTYADGVCVGADDDRWRCANKEGYVTGAAPPMTVRYLGVWDTVGALGVPEVVPGSRWLNRRHRFHDVSVDGFVEGARHALALDERRALFPPVSFGDVAPLNVARGFDPDDVHAPFQERWFPGVHGSVGGGGDVRGLSDGALAWVLEGAKRAGLRLDTARGTRIDGFSPDPSAPLVNVKRPSRGATDALVKDRAGPTRLREVSTMALRRWRLPAERLPEGKPYRPASLVGVRSAIEALPSAPFVPPTDLVCTHVLAEGETLSALAVRYYGDNSLWRLLFEANEDVIDDPNTVFPGWPIRIPRIAVANAK